MGLQEQGTLDTDSKGRWFVKMEKKIGVMLPQVKEGLGQSEAGRTRKNFTLELLHPRVTS